MKLNLRRGLVELAGLKCQLYRVGAAGMDVGAAKELWSGLEKAKDKTLSQLLLSHLVSAQWAVMLGLAKELQPQSAKAKGKI